MIGRLRGELVSKQAPHLMLDVQGVGYELEAPLTTFFVLPVLGQQVTLYTHLVVREDAHLLFGFASESERAAFRSLIKINGVGAKMALTILSGLSLDELARCVRDSDIATLVKLPGVGKKTAERLLVEMRDRLKDLPLTLPSAHPEQGALLARGSSAEEDAVSALIALGYKSQEASRMVRSVDAGDLSSEQIIRAALQAAAAKV